MKADLTHHLLGLVDLLGPAHSNERTLLLFLSMFSAAFTYVSNTADSAAARLVTCGPRQKKAKAVEPKNSISVGKGFSGKRKEPSWQCAQECGACCKLEKGPSFATPEAIFQDPSDVQLYRSLIGKDGWCIHYEKTTRTCSIYSERPYFCRVEPDVFQALYGIDEKRFNKEACSCCRDTIKAVYGARSKELDNFNHTIRNSSPS